ncbi:hypothetical protein AVEN_45974-1 [Araneus ventricosus]|uniref:Uncharacterized protein n=1 Tax=Araneus ventricosus TaxID=182803 RepID=A0A4Y2PH49_ARAVE|nr:hypothetical protein AVEN_45974-1 [Araneus ventricosus]
MLLFHARKPIHLSTRSFDTKATYTHSHSRREKKSSKIIDLAESAPLFISFERGRRKNIIAHKKKNENKGRKKQTTPRQYRYSHHPLSLLSSGPSLSFQFDSEIDDKRPLFLAALRFGGLRFFSREDGDGESEASLSNIRFIDLRPVMDTVPPRGSL